MRLELILARKTKQFFPHYENKPVLTIFILSRFIVSFFIPSRFILLIYMFSGLIHLRFILLKTVNSLGLKTLLSSNFFVAKISE